VTTSLEQLPDGATARVEALQGGFGFLQKVRDLGLEVGHVIKKVRHQGRGPILIQSGTQTIALGRGIAQRVLVRELPDEH
jgi:ferrous iron transport protein A